MFPDLSDVLGAWCLLFLLGILYNWLVVDVIERLDPPIGVTAWEVVGGVLFTAAVFAPACLDQGLVPEIE